MAMIALLVVALVGVIIYFMFFDTRGYKNLLIDSTEYLIDKNTYNFIIGTFSKDLKISKSGTANTYTFTTTEDAAYNFDLKTAPKSYNIKTIAGDKFFIKDSEKDEYLKYDGSTFSMVGHNNAFENNKNILLSTFIINPIAPDPTYDDIVIGPLGFVRDGASLKTITGTLNKCKAECSSNSMCIGFTYNNADSTCDLKTLSGSFVDGLSDYVSNLTAQYYYKTDTLGYSNTYTGTVTGFDNAPGTWNNNLNFEDCLQEAMSASSTGVVGVGYDVTNKKCLFSTGNASSTITLGNNDPKKMMMCFGDNNRDIKKGCKL